MSDASQCPRCQLPMVSAEGSTDTSDTKSVSLNCTACRGVFVPPIQIQESLLADAEHVDASADEISQLVCPGCQQPMQELKLGDVNIDRCGACGGVWLDGGEKLDPDSPADVQFALSQYFLYSLSLPERAVRSTIGIAAGAIRETAVYLVPQAFQSSKTYEIVVRNSLKFLTHSVGGVTATEDESNDIEGYMARKAVGNFIDIAGLATLHLSPIWLLAIVSDVAYGSKSYVLELAEELKTQGLIDETSTIHHIDDVLEAVQNATGTAASAFDTPPLSIDQLKQTVDDTRTAITSADYTSILPEAEVKKYWNDMKEIAERDHVSLLGVSGAMTLHSLGKFASIGKGAIAGVKVAGGLFNREILGHYVESLETIRERGFYQVVQESSTPYIEAVWNNFSTEKGTLTEELVTGRIFKKAFNGIKSWFTPEEESTDTETPKADANPATPTSN